MSSILDSILSGGSAAGAGDASSSLPPDLAAAIQGGGGADASQSSGGGDPVDVLDQMIELAKEYLDVEPDEEDKAVMTTCLQNFQKLKAKDQAEADGAMQGKTTPRMVRKAAAAQGGPGGPGY